MNKQCYRCRQYRMVKNGVSEKGYQRYRCTKCGHSYTSRTEFVGSSSKRFTRTSFNKNLSIQVNTSKPSVTPNLNENLSIQAKSAVTPNLNENISTQTKPTVAPNLADFIITLIFGWTGYWRFKNKQIGLGILWLLTGGLCGIGWIIDFIIVFVKYLQFQKQNPVQAAPTVPAVPQPLPQPSVSKPIFPDFDNGMQKKYSYEDVNLYTVPTEYPNFKSILMFGPVNFVQEPDNPYDNHAIYVTQNGIKLGYLYRGTLQDMANDYLNSGCKVIGFVSSLDYHNGVISINMAYYE